MLNYRGGSFLIDYYSPIAQECRIRGVSFNRITANGVLDIYTEIEQNNMDIVLLEKHRESPSILPKINSRGMMLSHWP